MPGTLHTNQGARGRPGMAQASVSRVPWHTGYSSVSIVPQPLAAGVTEGSPLGGRRHWAQSWPGQSMAQSLRSSSLGAGIGLRASALYPVGGGVLDTCGHTYVRSSPYISVQLLASPLVFDITMGAVPP